MRKKEQLLFDRFKRAKPRNVWLVRVENRVDDGMPDSWIAPATWVEFKVPSTSIKAIGAEDLRPSQRNWMRAAALTGTDAYILAERDRRIVLVPAPAVEEYLQQSAIEAYDAWGVENHKLVWEILLHENKTI